MNCMCNIVNVYTLCCVVSFSTFSNLQLVQGPVMYAHIYTDLMPKLLKEVANFSFPNLKNFLPTADRFILMS